MVIDAVFFDFGGVILTSPFEAFTSYEVRVGLPPDAIRTVNSSNPDDNAWARFERSELDVEQFISQFEAEADALGYVIDARDVLACLHGDLRPKMVEAVRRCSVDRKTALLTNNVISMRDERDATGSLDDAAHPFDDIVAMFDVVVESSVIGIRKPEPEFYVRACELADVDPRNVVFLDDLGVNLKPARSLGMTTIKVVDPDDALRELEAVLGIPLM